MWYEACGDGSERSECPWFADLVERYVALVRRVRLMRPPERMGASLAHHNHSLVLIKQPDFCAEPLPVTVASSPATTRSSCASSTSPLAVGA